MLECRYILYDLVRQVLQVLLRAKLLRPIDPRSLCVLDDHRCGGHRPIIDYRPVVVVHLRYHYDAIAKHAGLTCGWGWALGGPRLGLGVFLFGWAFVR